MRGSLEEDISCVVVSNFNTIADPEIASLLNRMAANQRCDFAQRTRFNVF